MSTAAPICDWIALDNAIEYSLCRETEVTCSSPADGHSMETSSS